jgi:hypothetical protein
MTQIKKRNIAIAVIGSFAVYLIPIFTVHISMLWGPTLWIEITRYASERGTPWVAADIGLALILQFIAGGLLYWMVAGTRIWRFLVSLAAVPVLAVSLQFAYLVVIPTFFLIESETQAEKGNWPVDCRVPNASVAAALAGPSAPLVRAGEVWITLAGSNPGTRKYAVSDGHTPGDPGRRGPLRSPRPDHRQTAPPRA